MTAETTSKSGALLRNLALCITAVTFVIAWLPLVRSLLDGPSYQWGTTFFGQSFSGAGLGGDFWFLAAQGALALTIVGLGFRRPGGLFYALFIGWLALNVANLGHGFIANPQALVFEGATLGIRVNIGLVALAIYAAALICAVAAALLEYTPTGDDRRVSRGHPQTPPRSPPPPLCCLCSTSCCARRQVRISSIRSA